MQKSYYQILGIAPTASRDQIVAAHMKAVAKLMESGIDDPDSNALLDTALETLTDDNARASYDESLQASNAPPRITARRADPPANIDGDGETSGSGSRTARSIGVFIAAVLLTVIVGWLMMRGQPAPPPPTQVAKEETRSLSAPVTGDMPPPADAAKPDATKAADPKPRTAEQVFADASASVVKVIVTDALNNPTGTGSGVVTARQTVITNCHVAMKGPNVTVKTLKDAYPASVTVTDEVYDLCQLDVSGLNAPAVEVGAMQYVRTGQKVFAIGAPQGLELTISEGIVSSLRETAMGNLIQTTAPISPGSSGGGLFNVNGQLIGITTFQHKTGQNLNFAVPADWIASMTTRSGSGPIPK